MSDWTQLIEAGFQKLGELAGKYGPPAIDTAASVVQVDAAGSIVRSGVALIFAVAAGVTASRLIRAGLRLNREYLSPDVSSCDPRGGQSVALQMTGAVLGVCGVGAAMVCLVTVCDVWTWEALLNPKLALAARVVHAIPGLAQ